MLPRRAGHDRRVQAVAEGLLGHRGGVQRLDPHELGAEEAEDEQDRDEQCADPAAGVADTEPDRTGGTGAGGAPRGRGARGRGSGAGAAGRTAAGAPPGRVAPRAGGAPSRAVAPSRVAPVREVPLRAAPGGTRSGRARAGGASTGGASGRGGPGVLGVLRPWPPRSRRRRRPCAAAPGLLRGAGRAGAGRRGGALRVTRARRAPGGVLVSLTCPRAAGAALPVSGLRHAFTSWSPARWCCPAPGLVGRAGRSGRRPSVTTGGRCAGADGDGVCETTVKPSPSVAFFATPTTLPSDRRRNAALGAGTMPISTARLARCGGDCLRGQLLGQGVLGVGQLAGGGLQVVQGEGAAAHRDVDQQQAEQAGREQRDASDRERGTSGPRAAARAGNDPQAGARAGRRPVVRGIRDGAVIWLMRCVSLRGSGAFCGPQPRRTDAAGVGGHLVARWAPRRRG